MSTMHIGDRSVARSRAIVIGLATLLALAVVPGAGPRPARAADTLQPSLLLPTDDQSASAATLTVTDEPPPIEGGLGVDPVIAAANAAVAALPPEAWEIEALAASLGTDPAAAFAFVRDSIGFDAYPGVLRGAAGTLAARAGNAFDRALLLKALLDAMGASSRFAFADLDAATSAALVARSFDRPARPLPDAGVHAASPAFAAAIATRAQRDYALLRAALGDRVTSLGSDPGNDPVTDTVHHAWVQVEEASGWLDLDPSMADATAGATLAPAASTADEIPSADRQSVTISVIAEMLSDGVLAESVALEQKLDASTASTAQILLTFRPDPGTSDGGLLGGTGRATAFIPVLTVDAAEQRGTAFPIPSGGGGGFFSDGTVAPELLSLRIAIVTEAPGHPAVVRDRIILDRVPPEARDAGSVTVDELRSVPYDWNGPYALGDIHHIMVSVGGASPRAAAIDRGNVAVFTSTELSKASAPSRYPLAALWWPMTVSDESLVLVSERALVPAVDADPDVRAFIARPRVYIASVGPDRAGADQVMATIDLAVDGLEIVPRDGSQPGGPALRQLWYGALQTALETEFGLRGAAILDAAGRRMIAVSLLMSQPLTVLTSDDAAALPSTTPRTLRLALEHDRIVVIPGEAAAAQTWWTIALADGTTRSLIDPALGAYIGIGPATPLEMQMGMENTWVGKLEDTVIRQACAGGTEYQTVEDCVATRSIQVDALIVEKFIHLMRAYAQFLVLG